MFEARSNKYVLKDIKRNFKVFSSGLVNNDANVYKFIDSNSIENQLFNSYVAHDDGQSKPWHERLGHLNYGKMQLLSKMVLVLPTISSTKGVCERCVLSEHHKEVFDKGKPRISKNNCN